MGDRRMFSTKITESDEFLDLPVTAQNLYFHLNMNADDRGFIGNPRTIMRMCGATNGDAKALLDNKFVLGFDGKSVILIKHWNTHNYIRKDRLHETNFIEQLKQIYLDENNNYSQNPVHSEHPAIESDNHVSQLTGNCQSDDGQLVGSCQAEDKLSKDKLSKSNSEVGKEGCGEKNPNRSLTAYGVYQNVLLDLGVMESLEDEFGMSYAGLAMQQLSNDLHQGKTIRFPDDHEAELRQRLTERRRR